MDLGTLVRLQTAADQAPMQNMGELTSVLSDTIRNRNARSLEQDAMRFFGDGEVSMDKIQQFQQMYPGVPATEIMKQAAAIGNQVEAQQMKDIYNTVGNIVMENGGKLDQKAFVAAAEQFPPRVRSKFMQVIAQNPQFLKQWSPTRTQRDPEKDIEETDAFGNVKTIKGTPKITQESRPYKVGEIVTKPGEGGKEVQNIVKGYDENNQPLWLYPDWKDVTKVKETTEKVWVHNPKQNIKKEVSRDVANVLTKQGWVEGTPLSVAEGEKPSRVAYRDTVTGAINYYDKNNPKDRETLQKYGKQLVPLAENPIQAIIRDALSGGANANSKVLDEETAKIYLEKAGGNKDKAREAAKKDGYTF